MRDFLKNNLMAVVVGAFVIAYVIYANTWGGSGCPLSAMMGSTQTTTEAPQWTARDLKGQTVASTQYADSLVLLNFWATWCGPCVKELPDLEKLHANFKDRGFKVVGVNLDEGDSSDIEDFIRKRNLSFPVIRPISNHMMEDFGGIRYIPTSFLISPDGKIIRRFDGKVSFDSLESIVEQHLPAPKPETAKQSA